MKKDKIKTVKDILMDAEDGSYICPFCKEYHTNTIEHENWCPLKGKRLDQPVGIRIEQYGFSTQITFIIKR